MYLISKRIFDIFLSGIAIALLSPILILIIVILKLTGEGEVFYLQERVGYKKNIFIFVQDFGILKKIYQLQKNNMILENMEHWLKKKLEIL